MADTAHMSLSQSEARREQKRLGTLIVTNLPPALLRWYADVWARSVRIVNAQQDHSLIIGSVPDVYQQALKDFAAVKQQAAEASKLPGESICYGFFMPFIRRVLPHLDVWLRNYYISACRAASPTLYAPSCGTEGLRFNIPNPDTTLFRLFRSSAKRMLARAHSMQQYRTLPQSGLRFDVKTQLLEALQAAVREALNRGMPHAPLPRREPEPEPEPVPTPEAPPLAPLPDPESAASPAEKPAPAPETESRDTAPAEGHDDAAAVPAVAEAIPAPPETPAEPAKPAAQSQTAVSASAMYNAW